MRGMRGEVFAHLPGRRGSPGGRNGAQNGAIFPRGSLESTQNSPVLTQIGPGLARESLESGHGWLGGAWGGCCERVDSREEIFGLLNFCCTRQVVLFLRGGFI